jgi:peptidyl-prolyl cis-trans isomerase B (cyclophilin B)
MVNRKSRIGLKNMLFDRASGNISFCHRWWIPVLVLALLPALGCGRYRARNELKRNEYFAQILQRVDLRWIGEDRFFEENLLANPSPEVREWCAIALGRIGSKSALPLLYRAIHTGDAAVRAASAFAIGEIEDRELLTKRNLPPDPNAAKELLSLLADHSLTVQMRAIEALGKTGTPSEASEIVRRLDRFSYSGLPIERAYIGFAITALARLKDPVALPALTRLENAGDSEFQWRASEALGILGNAASAPVTAASTGSPGSEPVPLPGLNRIGDTRIMPATATDIVRRTLAASRKNSTIAVVETTRGTLEIMLFREDAPLTVANFVLTANRGNYSGFVFDRAVRSKQIGGRITGLQSGFDIAPDGEINMRPFERGSVGISFQDAESPKGRFFIALAPQPYLDGVDTCFGRVISGMPVADRIVSGDKILRIHIKETVGLLERIRY